MRKIFLIIFLFFFIVKGFSQNKYWIFLKDKENISQDYKHNFVSSNTLKNRLLLQLPAFQYSDMPLKQEYIELIEKQDVHIKTKSKWLNAISATLDEDQKQALLEFDFVTGIEMIDGRLLISSTGEIDSINYPYVLKQVQAQAFQKEKLSGKGINIGIIDAGFYQANQKTALKYLFEQNQIKSFKDYLEPTASDNYSIKFTELDNHGTDVLQLIGGYRPNINYQEGLAYDASYYLARTDHGVLEYRGEEDLWIAAMEWMDSVGVRVINTSLGYAVGFTDKKENYRPSEMDGNTSRISRAANIAFEEKGILIIVSAGNEGTNSKWRIVSTPADATGVLTVGAIGSHQWSKMNYSSIGAEFVDYIKPDVVCYSMNGTSFSAPVITGFAACLLEKKPDLSNKELIDIIKKSAHLYPFGNNYIGYGVPQAGIALGLINERENVKEIKIVKVKNNMYSFDTPSDQEFVLFHKKNNWMVVKQEVIKPVNGKLKIERMPKVSSTTIQNNQEVVEVIWE